MNILQKCASAAVLALAAMQTQALLAAETNARSAPAKSEGEIVKVDRDGGKLTIRHGPLKNLDMGAMTMSFRVRDASMLDQVKVGDPVRFVADKVDGRFVVQEIEARK